MMKLFILNTVLQRPGIYLREIQKELEDVLMIEISISTICKFLCKSGFTRQRLCIVATQQDTFLREQYIIDVSLYSPIMFIFVDETGADHRNNLRKYGYSVRGKPAVLSIIPYYSGYRLSHACQSMVFWMLK